MQSFLDIWNDEEYRKVILHVYNKHRHDTMVNGVLTPNRKKYTNSSLELRKYGLDVAAGWLKIHHDKMDSLLDDDWADSDIRYESDVELATCGAKLRKSDGNSRKSSSSSTARPSRTSSFYISASQPSLTSPSSSSLNSAVSGDPSVVSFIKEVLQALADLNKKADSGVRALQLLLPVAEAIARHTDTMPLRKDKAKQSIQLLSKDHTKVTKAALQNLDDLTTEGDGYEENDESEIDNSSKLEDVDPKGVRSDDTEDVNRSHAINENEEGVDAMDVDKAAVQENPFSDNITQLLQEKGGNSSSSRRRPKAVEESKSKKSRTSSSLSTHK